MGKKKAVLIGCNYPGTEYALTGCVNDAMNMCSLLVNFCGFLADDITVLVDSDGSHIIQPTGENIWSALHNLVTSALSGDILFVHYSGHGTRVPIQYRDGDEDNDIGYDECIVPTDYNLIFDDDLRTLLNHVPEGCRLTIVSDASKSAGLVGRSKDQMMESLRRPSFGYEISCLYDVYCFGFKSFSSCFSSDNYNRQKDASRDADLVPKEENLSDYKLPTVDGEEQNPEDYFRKKYLPTSSLIEMLKLKAGRDDIHAGNLKPALFEIFGENASPKVKKLANKPAIGTRLFSNIYASSPGGILIGCCKTNQLSIDCNLPENAYGALSYAIQSVVAKTNGKVTNLELVKKVGKMVACLGQRPALYCSDEDVNAGFLT